jgi:hypothetical protein
VSKSVVGSEAWWEERGVAAEVREHRPYVRWTTTDIEPVREAYAGLSTGQLRTLLRWARQSDGLVIYRHSFEAYRLASCATCTPRSAPTSPFRPM